MNVEVGDSFVSNGL